MKKPLPRGEVLLFRTDLDFLLSPSRGPPVYAACILHPPSGTSSMLSSTRLQQRDLDVLQDIGQSRFLTYKQIADLWFKGSIHAARKRILKLKQVALVAIYQPAFRNPSLVLLTRSGAASLRDNGYGGRLHPSAFDLPGVATLSHELALRDLKTAWIQRTRVEQSEIEDFCLISNELAFSTQYGSVRPDAYVRTKAGAEAKASHFFIELDQGTESLDRIEWKIVQYWNFYREGGFAARMGVPRESYKLVPFRVILVLNAENRIRSVSKRLLSKGFQSFVQVALVGNLTSSTLALDAIKPLRSITRPFHSGND